MTQTTKYAKRVRVRSTDRTRQSGFSGSSMGDKTFCWWTSKTEKKMQLEDATERLISLTKQRPCQEELQVAELLDYYDI